MVGLERIRHAQAQGLGDQRPARRVIPVDEGDGRARVARAARAADAVDVDLLVFGALVVDDVRDVVDVDASRGDVGGDQDVDLAVTEGAQRLLASTLAQVAVQRTNREAAGSQVLAQAGGGALGAAEDDGAAATLRLENAGDDLDLVHGVNAVDDLLDRVDGLVLVVGVLRADVGRLDHEAAGEGHDGAGHGRGEQHGVAVLGDAGQQCLDVGQEAQVEHLVGLVEDDGFDAGQVQVALAQQVDEAAGRAHDDVGATLESLDLGLEGDAAVDFDDAGRQVLGGLAQVLGDLLGEFAGRQDDECLRLVRVEQVLVALFVGRDDVLEDRDAEAEGLTGAGLGLADDVVALQRGAKRQGLDREGVRDALVFEGVDDRVGDAEVREGLLVEILALAGNVRGGLFDLGGCGLDVAEADDACGVFDGRGRGGLLGGVNVGGGHSCLSARVGHDLPCLPGFSGVGVGADRALSGAGMFVRA